MLSAKYDTAVLSEAQVPLDCFITGIPAVWRVIYKSNVEQLKTRLIV